MTLCNKGAIIMQMTDDEGNAKDAAKMQQQMG